MESFFSVSDLSAIWLTVKLATVVTLILLLIGTPIAWWLARTRSVWKGPVGALVALPIVLPPTVLGFYLLVTLGPNGPIGHLTQALGLGVLPFTFAGLVVGSVLYSMPFVVQPLQNAFEAIGERPLEVAATLRASSLDAFFSVALPLAKPGFLTAIILGFAHTVGEFGVVLMIGGNIPDKTRVVSVQIYDHVEALEYAQAHWLSAGMVLFAFLVLLVLYTLNPGAAARMSIHARFRIDHPGFTLDVDLQLPGRGVSALFGASGSGKTTCLRAIAGLERAPCGYLEVNGAVWQDDARGIFLPTHQRMLGYVFQEASLFAHLDIRRNLDYGLRRVPADKRKLDRRHVLDLLGIAALQDRMPDRLSGGERQRVAIARALLTSPQLLLMDEPLAALDLARKQEILPYLERLHDELDIPMLYVSHAPDEVAHLADHLVVLEQGRVLASGPLSETLARIDLPIRLGEDAGVVLEGEVTERDAQWHLAHIAFPGGQLLVRDSGVPIGQRVRVRILARDISLALATHSDSSILNVLHATVEQIAADTHPALALVRLNAGGVPLVARVTRRSADKLQLHPGQNLWAQIKAVALVG